MTSCKICESQSERYLKAFIFEKGFEIDYFQCKKCSFVQTQEPDWLAKAYTDVIAQLDIGLLSRNRGYSDLTEKLLLTFFNDSVTFLDFGAGYGVFVRMMRDKGFDFKWYDEYCENFFAKGFEENDPGKETDVITAFEVLEHLPDPQRQLEPLIKNSKLFIFSTDITYREHPDFENWWYRAPFSGQHVSFYTRESLEIIAKKYNKNFYSDNKGYHFICDKKLDQRSVDDFFQPRIKLTERILNKALSIIRPESVVPRETLLQKDHAFLINLYHKP